MDHTTHTPTNDVDINKMIPGLVCQEIVEDELDDGVIYSKFIIPKTIFDVSKFQIFPEVPHFNDWFFQSVIKAFEKFEHEVGIYLRQFCEDKGNTISKVFIIDPVTGNVRGSLEIQRDNIDDLPTYGVISRGDNGFYLPFLKSEADNINLLNNVNPMGIRLPRKDGEETYPRTSRVDYKDFLSTTVYIMDEPEPDNPFKILILSGAVLDDFIDRELNGKIDMYYDFAKILHDVVGRIVNFGIRWTYRRQGHIPIFTIPITFDSNFTISMHREDRRILLRCLKEIVQPSLDATETKLRMEAEVTRLLEYPRYVEGNTYIIPLLEYIRGLYCKWELLNQKGFFIPQTNDM